MLRAQDGTEDNPYTFEARRQQIQHALKKAGFEYNQYEIIEVPNITHITYGRDVGYDIIEHKPPEEIKEISGTKIRKEND